MAKEKGIPDAPQLPPHLEEESAAQVQLPDLHAPTVGRRMATFRDHLHLSQAELAARVGGSKMGLQGNERGVAAPNSRTLYGLLLLGANLNWLLGGEGPMLRRELMRPRPPIDQEILSAVISGVEMHLSQEQLVLSPEKKAQLVSLLYEQCAAEGEVKSATILRLVKLAA